MLYIRTILAAVLAGAVVATPSTLMKRDEKLTMSAPFFVLPASDHTLLITSNNSSFLYDDGSCSTSGATIPTPSGSGTWSTSNCGAATDQVLGTINAGGNTYTCYRANNQNFDNDCLDYLWPLMPFIPDPLEIALCTGEGTPTVNIPPPSPARKRRFGAHLYSLSAY
ncbi:uncharacterized protein LACBIDRAFT_331476 [Laccaria bicolor S238N-H82]|uniref:Predicted protein n=1 Tax=Laccaria bicolor (strain S238N-H82 / ATCC MYA-4686) TaxID=486041 RepID=B0DPK9_LACBS|nr:uncharacterized protein LACBIDRAFT_331476 [Laccaria bicolor S238N-H82]EDR03392.1 predicted protein [Laccaria bicolor S238N-H82]|eukprot:XP_001885848.1 predicted protein [Laccaria bicolor S238N-H82]